MVDVVSRVRNKLSAVQRAFSAATESIADIRREIDAVRAERERIATAPRPVAEVVTQFDAMLDTWACAGQAGGIGVSIDGIIARAMAGHPPSIELHQRCTLGHVTSLLPMPTSDRFADPAFRRHPRPGSRPVRSRRSASASRPDTGDAHEAVAPGAPAAPDWRAGLG